MSCTINVSLHVCNYNMGNNVKDYISQRVFFCPHYQPKTQKDLIEEYEKIQTDAAMTLISNPCDVYFLQESVHKGRPLINLLLNKNFKIFHKQSDSFDTVVALNETRFSEIKQYLVKTKTTNSFDNREATIIVTKDELMNQPTAFVSGHAPGFNFDLSDFAKETERGDSYCQDIVDKLDEVAQDCIQIIGIDMNTSPEKWQKRFDIFLKKGFQLKRLNKTTNVNPKALIDAKREIDFFLIKMPSLPNLSLSFQEDDVISPLNWEENGSDHLPLKTKFIFKKISI